MQKPIPDQFERNLSLDPEKSFIVQAPAGSGKTELLIQRFLILLTQVNFPEEVIAITFTRKAALEMRERILMALHKAVSQTVPPTTSHAQKTWQLACRVLEQDHRLGWNLLDNPGRLKVQTIDSLAHQIVSRMPLMNEFATVTEITENPDWLYSLSIRNLFHRETTNTQIRSALKQLLAHLNNDGAKLEGLLKSMLAKRDQWLEHVIRPREREYLEEGLKRLNQKLLEHCHDAFPEANQAEVLQLLSFVDQLKEQDTLEKLPGTRLEDKESWEKIARFLLKKDFKFRENVNQGQGFPSESAAKNTAEKHLFKEMKVRFKCLINALRENEACRQSLQAILESPPCFYSETQWHILSALIQVLKHLLAELKLVFYEKKRVDFTEIMLAAREGLGAEDQPTELGLVLDYKIQHLLMDEFQDTSMMQFKLIERLISGWQSGDGRTLFLVGDPMQSIYRFRQAEVGLFLIAQKQGIGNIKLTPVTLSVNFRSEAKLLAWVNQQFAEIFPATADIHLGAVPYTPSMPFHETRQTNAVFTHTVKSENEGEMVVSLIQEKWRLDPQHRVAVLVRSRAHLNAIIPALLKAGLKFQALDIVPLKEQPVIYDLYALTCVLFCPIDRLAWFSVLRAPWCGMSLADLHALVYRNTHQDLLQLLQSDLEMLSEDGRSRCQRVVKILIQSLAQRNRETAGCWVKSVWLALNAPLCYEDESSIHYAEYFFELLEKMAEEAGFVDLGFLDARLEALFAESPEGANDRLQLMTIHKSKGLEFDTVIIPGLERKPKNDTAPILRWLEQAYLEEKASLVLAPIQALGHEYDPIYEYLGSIEKNKQKQEWVRLLYVAATRARSCLHWVTCIEADELASSGSFLSLLRLFNFTAYTGKEEVGQSAEKSLAGDFLKVKRLSAIYFTPASIEQAQADRGFSSKNLMTENNQFDEKLGSVIHHLLDQWVKQKSFKTFVENERLWKKWVLKAGILPDQIPLAFGKIRQAIQAVLNDPRGQWIVNPYHRESRSEYAITLKKGEFCQHVRVDRTFIDEKGRRWIIDYKSSTPRKGQSLEDFFKEVRRKHSDQLKIYKQAMQGLGEEPVFLGWYFPLIPAWYELMLSRLDRDYHVKIGEI